MGERRLAVQYEDVLEALPRVRRVLSPTPLYQWPGLCRLLGFPFWLKHENHQPVGAFKVRGGVNLVSTLGRRERAAGVWAVSTGNHGQSLAFACARFGVRCTIVVPEGNNPDKNEAMRLLGARLIEHGRDFDEARQYLESVIAQEGGRYVHSANEPLLIAGVGTLAYEIFESLPDPDVLLVPIGLGSGVSGAGLVARRRRPRTQVIGVQAAGAAAVAESWRAGRPVETERADTWAEGLATRVPAEMTLEIMRRVMDDVVLVSDDDLRWGVYQILKRTHNLAEGAGAAALAAAWRLRRRLAGKRVVGVLSGGNLDMAALPDILERGRRPPP